MTIITIAIEAPVKTAGIVRYPRVAYAAIVLAMSAGPAWGGDGDPGSRSGFNGGGGARQAGDTFTSPQQGVTGKWVQPSIGISIWRAAVDFNAWLDSWRAVTLRQVVPQRLGYSVSGGNLTRTNDPSRANGWGVANPDGGGWRGY